MRNLVPYKDMAIRNKYSVKKAQTDYDLQFKFKNWDPSLQLILLWYLSLSEPLGSHFWMQLSEGHTTNCGSTSI